MCELRFLHPDQAPTPEAARAFPHDIALASSSTREKTVFFHDESTYQASDDQPFQWGKKGEHILRPENKGSGIMVSDFVDERNGYLALTDEEFPTALATDPDVTHAACQLLEYGEFCEGYWTSEKLMSQMECAVRSEDSIQ